MKDYDFSAGTNTRIGFSNRLGANAADQADALAARLAEDEWLTVRIPLIGGTKDGTPELHDGTRTVGKVSLRAVHLLEEAGTLREASRSPFRRTLTYSGSINEPHEEPAMPDTRERITLSAARKRLGIKPSTLENYVAPSSGPILATEGRGKDRRVVVDEEFQRRESAYLESLEDEQAEEPEPEQAAAPEPVKIKLTPEVAEPTPNATPEVSGDGQADAEPDAPRTVSLSRELVDDHARAHPIDTLLDEAAREAQRERIDPLRSAGAALRVGHEQAQRVLDLLGALVIVIGHERGRVATLVEVIHREQDQLVEQLEMSDRAAPITAHRSAKARVS